MCSIVKYGALCVMLFVSFNCYSQLNPEYIEVDGQFYIKSEKDIELKNWMQEYYNQSDYKTIAELTSSNNEIEERVQAMGIDIIGFIKPKLLLTYLSDYIGELLGIGGKCKSQDELFKKIGEAVFVDFLREKEIPIEWEKE